MSVIRIGSEYGIRRTCKEIIILLQVVVSRGASKRHVTEKVRLSVRDNAPRRQHAPLGRGAGRGIIFPINQIGAVHYGASP
jgi:hypothetical protein